jgi:hypothetical protein
VLNDLRLDQWRLEPRLTDTLSEVDHRNDDATANGKDPNEINEGEDLVTIALSTTTLRNPQAIRSEPQLLRLAMSGPRWRPAWSCGERAKVFAPAPSQILNLPTIKQIKHKQINLIDVAI